MVLPIAASRTIPGMGLGLTLVAKLPNGTFLRRSSPERSFQDVSRVVSTDRSLSVFEGEGALRISSHPAAEPIDVFIDERRLVLSASTTACGPGYHASVCRLAERIARETGIEWIDGGDEDGDETGYWTDRDFSALQEAHSLWIRSVCGVALDLSPGSTLSMPVSAKPTTVGHVLTQTGPRSYEWVQQVAEGVSDGRDFFPWWDEAEDGRSDLGRALVSLWMHDPWEMRTDARTIALRQQNDKLLRRADQDGVEGVPWGEWAEFLEWMPDVPQDHLNRVRSRAAGKREASLVGYRRNPVQHLLGSGWEITLPGAMTPNDDTSHWSVFSEKGNVGCSLFKTDNPAPPDLPRGFTGDSLHHDIPGVSGEGRIAEPEPGRWLAGWVGQAGTSIALFTFTFDGSDGRTRAEEALHGINHRGID